MQTIFFFLLAGMLELLSQGLVALLIKLSPVSDSKVPFFLHIGLTQTTTNSQVERNIHEYKASGLHASRAPGVYTNCNTTQTHTRTHQYNIIHIHQYTSGNMQPWV